MKINKVIKVLISSDFALQSGWGLIAPIFAIFLTNQIKGGSLEVVGFTATVYWVAKSIIQPFFADWMDKKEGERDDFVYLVVGSYVAAIIPFGYIFATLPWHIYALEFVRAIAMAAAVPSWAAIFTRHIDKGREAFSWSLESTGLGFAAGIAGAVGAWLVGFFGFQAVFFIVGLFSVISATVLVLVRDSILPRDGFSPRVPPIEKPF